MATAGPNTAGTGADDSSVGTLAWTNPGNITSSDDVYSTITNNTGQSTHYLKATNFGFSIPGGSTINGIVVEWERKTAVAAQTRDNSIKLVKGGTIQGNDNSASATWSTTESFVSFGSSSDLWGLTLTSTDVNASDFGAVIQATSLGSSGTASVDSCRITVTYTAGSLPPNEVNLISTSDFIIFNDFPLGF